MKVYIVKQYQYDSFESHIGEPVYVFFSEEKAKSATVELNREYSDGVIWVNGEEFLTVDDYDTVNEPHFYTYGVYEIKE